MEHVIFLGLTRVALMFALLLPIIGWIAICWKFSKGSMLGLLFALIGVVSLGIMWGTFIVEMDWP